MWRQAGRFDRMQELTGGSLRRSSFIGTGIVAVNNGLLSWQISDHEVVEYDSSAVGGSDDTPARAGQ